MTSLAAGWDHILLCLRNGSVRACGWNNAGQAEPLHRNSDSQPQMVAVSAGEQHR